MNFKKNFYSLVIAFLVSCTSSSTMTSSDSSALVFKNPFSDEWPTKNTINVILNADEEIAKDTKITIGFAYQDLFNCKSKFCINETRVAELVKLQSKSQTIQIELNSKPCKLLIIVNTSNQRFGSAGDLYGYISDTDTAASEPATATVIDPKSLKQDYKIKLIKLNEPLE